MKLNTFSSFMPFCFIRLLANLSQLENHNRFTIYCDFLQRGFYIT